MNPDDYGGWSNFQHREPPPKYRVYINTTVGEFVLFLSREEIESLRARSVEQQQSPQYDPRSRTYVIGGQTIPEEILVRARNRGNQQYDSRPRSKSTWTNTGTTTNDQQFWENLRDAAQGASQRINEERLKREQQAAEAKTKKAQEPFRKLASIAGVDWEEAKHWDTRKLSRAAMRKAHPDTGGNHEKWLEYSALIKSMGLKV